MITHPQTIRLSHLCDMLTCHIIAGRTIKAILIAHYLRDRFGFHLCPGLNHATGYRSAVDAGPLAQFVSESSAEYRAHVS